MRNLLLGLILSLAACGDSGGDTILDDGGNVLDASKQSDDGGTPSSGRTGLEGSCDRYKACGGSYYGTAQACIDAAVGYWGTCRKAELDAFGECMRVQDCSLAGSDGYIPSQTPCAKQYATLASAPGCK